jgi:hypothetical protein
VHSHNHHEDWVRNRVANVIQTGPEAAPDIQLGSQHAVQIIHHIVVEDQGQQVLVSLLPKENADRKHAKNRDDVRQVPDNKVSL